MKKQEAMLVQRRDKQVAKIEHNEEAKEKALLHAEAERRYGTQPGLGCFGSIQLCADMNVSAHNRIVAKKRIEALQEKEHEKVLTQFNFHSRLLAMPAKEMRLKKMIIRCKFMPAIAPCGKWKFYITPC